MLFGHKTIPVSDFEAAALPHIDTLYRTARRMVGDSAEAEDLVQETYLQAWKSFHRFELGTNCRAWLFKILFHVVQHHRRKHFALKISKSIGEGEDLIEDQIAWEPPIPEDLRDEDVLASMQKIPPQFREVVLLADVQDFSYREIAEILQIPVGTVMSRLSRGRKMLRTELAGFAAGYGIKAAEEMRGQGL
jgi:RNA polymerase sigma-70 factor (ECF subfamily)